MFKNKMKSTLALAAVSGAAIFTGASASADQWGAPYGQDYGYSQAPVATYMPEQVEQTYAGDSSYATADTTSTTTSTVAATTTSSSSDNTYPVGQCTWGVKELASWAGNNWGNAADWAASAATAGFTVGTTPQVGAIAVWNDGGYGHVAYVTDVQSANSIQVLESNYNGNMSIGNYRGYFDPTTAQGTVSYIYPNA